MWHLAGCSSVRKLDDTGGDILGVSHQLEQPRALMIGTGVVRFRGSNAQQALVYVRESLCLRSINTECATVRWQSSQEYDFQFSSNFDGNFTTKHAERKTPTLRSD